MSGARSKMEILSKRSPNFDVPWALKKASFFAIQNLVFSKETRGIPLKIRSRVFEPFFIT